MKLRNLLFFLIFSFSMLAVNAAPREIDSDDLMYDIMPRMTRPIVIDFWASWCGPCRMYHPTFNSVASSYSSRADFYRVDIDDNPDLAREFEIQCVPTTIVIYSKSGDYYREEGVISASDLRSVIDRARRNLDLSDSF